MKKLLLFLCVLSLTLFAFAACNKDKGTPDDSNNSIETCEHTYSEAWTSNSAEHWHKATCEHNSLKSDVAAHTDADEDGECDVCEYLVGHTHTYSDEWTTDETHHWRKATCTHTAEKGELGAHTDSDSNGSCDACSIHMHAVGLDGKCMFCGEQIVEVGGGETACKHTYSENWSYDSGRHWHAATCSHTDLKIDIVVHSDEDENGRCDVCNYAVGHDHTFSDTWTTNDSYHWKEAICSHTGEKSELGAHVDTDNDEKCDVCNVSFTIKEDKPCDHTYSTAWTSDAAEHWHAATCEHMDLKTDVAAHTDSDEDGKCDVCNYLVGHVHTYSTEWSYDENSHWRVANCSHTNEIGYLNGHRDDDANGNCDECTAHVHSVNETTGMCNFCGEKIRDVDTTGLGYVVYFLSSKASSITGGSILYDNVCTWVSEGNFKVQTKQEIDYVMGNNAAYYKITSTAGDQGQYVDVLEKWYEIANGNPFGVYKYTYDTDYYVDAAIANNVVGYYYSVSTLASAYGAENILIELYKLSQLPFAVDYEYNPDPATGNYSFSFGYVDVNSDTAEGEPPRVDYYEVTVSFTASKTGALTYLNILCKCYTNFSDEEADRDYTYDSATGKITLKPDAVADTYSFVITQTEGVRTYTSEHPKVEFLPTDYSIFEDEECTKNINGVYSATVNKLFYLYLGNFDPVGTSASYAQDNFTIFCDSANVICFTNPINSSILINVKKAGTYTVTVSVDGVEKNFIVTTEEIRKPEDNTVTGNNVSVLITDNNAWVDQATFTAPSDGDYTFTIAPGVYLGAEDANTRWADYNVTDESENPTPIGGSITVSLKAGETYSFFVMSPEKDVTVYIHYTVSAYTGN